MTKLLSYTPETSKCMLLPVYASTVAAGFPSPADDYVERKLDLNEYLIKSPSSTFFVRALGNSMTNAGIFSGDLLIVDRSLVAKNKSIVLAIVNGEFTVKRFIKKNDRYFLVAENDEFKPIEIREDMECEIWGVVTNVIHSLQ